MMNGVCLHDTKPRNVRNRAAHRRRGFAYALTLGVAMCVTVIGLSALMATQIERRSVQGVTDFARARLYAQSAIELGSFWIRDDSGWRDNRPDGIWAADQPIAGGTFTLEVIDPDDNNIKSEPNNFIVMTGTGIQGEARYKLRVTVEAVSGGYQISTGTWPGTWKQVVD